MGAAILLSRLVGLVRQRLIAHYLGIGDAADVLTQAFRLGNVAQNLLGEGSLSATFIPTYAKLQHQEPAKAGDFARAALGWLLIVLLALVVLGLVFAKPMVHALAPGFDAFRLAETVHAFRVVVPMAAILVIGAWGLGVLNTHGRFFVPYAAPVVWSLAQIVGAVVLYSRFDLRGADLAFGICVSALIGAILQTLLVVIPARHLLGSLRPSFERSPELLAAAKRLPAALLGRGIVQIAAFVDTILVSFCAVGASAVLSYAQTLFLLPLAIAGTSEAAAVLPALSREADPEAQRDQLTASLKRNLGFAIVAAAGLTFVGRDVVRLLLQTGSFDASDTSHVSDVLMLLAIGLPANAAGRIWAVSFYARNDTSRPAWCAAVRLVVAGAVSAALIHRIDVRGIAVGSFIGAWLEFALLAGSSPVKLGWDRVRALHIERGVGTAIAGWLLAWAARSALSEALPRIASVASLFVYASVALVGLEVSGVWSVRRLLRRSAP